MASALHARSQGARMGLPVFSLTLGRVPISRPAQLMQWSISMTAFFGTAWGNMMKAARRSDSPMLNSSGVLLGHLAAQSPQPVHLFQST